MRSRIVLIAVTLLNTKVLVSDPSIDISGIRTHHVDGIHADHHLFKHKSHFHRNSDLAEPTVTAATSANELGSGHVSVANAEKVSTTSPNKFHAKRTMMEATTIKYLASAPEKLPHPNAERVIAHKKKHAKSNRGISSSRSSRFKKFHNRNKKVGVNADRVVVEEKEKSATTKIRHNTDQTLSQTAENDLQVTTAASQKIDSISRSGGLEEAGGKLIVELQTKSSDNSLDAAGKDTTGFYKQPGTEAAKEATERSIKDLEKELKELEDEYDAYEEYEDEYEENSNLTLSPSTTTRLAADEVKQETVTATETGNTQSTMVGTAIKGNRKSAMQISTQAKENGNDYAEDAQGGNGTEVNTEDVSKEGPNAAEVQTTRTGSKANSLHHVYECRVCNPDTGTGVTWNSTDMDVFASEKHEAKEVMTCRSNDDCKDEKAYCMQVSDSSLSVCVESKYANQIYRDAAAHPEQFPYNNFPEREVSYQYCRDEFECNTSNWEIDFGLKDRRSCRNMGNLGKICVSDPIEVCLNGFHCRDQFNCVRPRSGSEFQSELGICIPLS